MLQASRLFPHLQDFGAPDTIIWDFNGIPFNTALAIDNPSDFGLVQQSGADSSHLASDALFGVSSVLYVNTPVLGGVTCRYIHAYFRANSH